MAVRRTYLDHVASTPLDAGAREALLRALTDLPGNPSSPHLEGRAAKDVLEDPDSARIAERVADEVAAAVINICSVVDPQLIVLGGGTATDALLTRVRYRVGEELLWKPELLRSALGEEAQLYGALFGALGVVQKKEAA